LQHDKQFELDSSHLYVLSCTYYAHILILRASNKLDKMKMFKMIYTIC